MSIRRNWNVLLSHLAVRYPDVKCRRTEFWIWNVPRRQAIQINSIRIPPKKTCASCYPALVNITLRMITYPIRIWCSDGKHWLKWASLATAHVPPLSNGVSGRPVWTSFAMDSKELSSILDCFRDQKALKTPKLNTILLELIVRVLNMLIGLKGDNYYSKVFKRVNYKLSNNTFWVVIMSIRITHDQYV